METDRRKWKMNSENFIFFVKSFNFFEWAKENYPEVTKSFYGTDKHTKDINNLDGGRASNFRVNIRDGIEKARVFEIDEDVKKLLCLTDTPIKNDEIHLPFDVIFLDIKFSKEELLEWGIEIDAQEIRGILGREGVLINQFGEHSGKDLNITMLSKQKNDDVWFDTFNKNCNLNENFKNMKVTISENDTTDKKARDFVHKFFLNFLNFLNNPEVEYVEHLRSAKNQERRAKQGKAIIPSTMTIKVSGKLKEYIDEAVNNECWTYGYRFWVRGHFRQLSSERFTEKKRIWILPYIKGKGVLVEKTYALENN